MQTRYPATAMLLLCWLSAVGCSASPEEQARAALKQVGGTLRSNSQEQLISVDLSDTPAGDDVLALIRYFPTVETINCANAQRVTGRGLAQLGGLSHLETLYLVNTGLDDAGLQSVQHLTSLKTLHLGRTRITDAGLPAHRAAGEPANPVAGQHRHHRPRTRPVAQPAQPLHDHPPRHPDHPPRHPIVAPHAPRGTRGGLTREDSDTESPAWSLQPDGRLVVVPLSVSFRVPHSWVVGLLVVVVVIGLYTMWTCWPRSRPPRDESNGPPSEASG